MQQDRNYNIRVEFDNGTESYIYAQRLHNEGLDYWQGWQCRSGVHSLHIYESEIYGGECRNDLLGVFGNWQLIDQWTTCKRERCGGCTVDLLQEKNKPNE